MGVPRRGALGRRIEFFEHPKYGGHVPIYLDVKSGIFAADYADARFRAGTIQEIREALTGALRGDSSLKWYGVIEVSFGYGSGYWERDDENSIKEDFDFRFERFWVARRADGSGRKSTFTHKAEQDRLLRSDHYDVPFESLPFTVKERNEQPKHYLAYTKELWESLVRIQKMIVALKNGLMELCADDRKIIAGVNPTITKLLKGK